MMNKITLPNKDKFSLAMQNVIWSIAVQHGPGNSSLLAIINNFGGTPGDKNSEAQLIKQLYQRRGQIWSPGIASRYRREQSNALAMLDAINSADIYNQNIAEIP